MDTSASGTFSATYTLSFSDEDLLGGSSLPDLLLTLKGAVEVVDLLRGDFNGNGVLDAGDIEMLVGDAQEPSLDLTGDGVITQDDRVYWVHDLANTWFGDADLDGEFNSDDFVQVFQAGKYETGELYAGWSEGDWNADGFFDSNDFITAFTDGGYEQGPRTDAVTVPEPSGVLLLSLGCLSAFGRRHRYVLIVSKVATDAAGFVPPTRVTLCAYRRLVHRNPVAVPTVRLDKLHLSASVFSPRFWD